MSVPSSSATASAQVPRRRAACDHCRLQKLRCVRNPSSPFSKCDRCIAAKAKCNFGVPKAAGRPPSTGTKDSPKHHDGPKSAQNTSRSAPRINNVSDSQDLSTSPLQSWSNSTGIRSTEGSWAAPSSDQNAFLSPSYEEICLPGVIDMDLVHLDSSSLIDFSTNHQKQQPSNPSTPVSGNTGSQLFSQSSGLYNSSDFFDCLATFDTQFIDTNIEPTEKGFALPGSSYEKEQHPIHHLSELSMSLYNLFIESNDLRQEMGDNRPLSEFPCGFAGRLLENSKGFLELLLSFQKTSDGVKEEHLESPQQPLETFSAGSSPSADSNFDETFSITPRRDSFASYSTTPTEKKTNRRADMSIILQLLACYLRITQLHNILYTVIYNFITNPREGSPPQASSSSSGTQTPEKLANQPPSIFPGLQIGGVHLESFGIFQIKLLLQISAHILGEIESALSLPDGYRVSRKKDDEASGVLGVAIPPIFFEMTVADNESAGGQDGILGSKARLGKLRSLLKGSINI